MSHSEAAQFLNVRVGTVQQWVSGRNIPPDGVLDEMLQLIEAIKLAASGGPDNLPFDSCRYQALALRTFGAV